MYDIQCGTPLIYSDRSQLSSIQVPGKFHLWLCIATFVNSTSDWWSQYSFHHVRRNIEKFYFNYEWPVLDYSICSFIPQSHRLSNQQYSCAVTQFLGTRTWKIQKLLATCTVINFMKQWIFRNKKAPIEKNSFRFPLESKKKKKKIHPTFLAVAMAQSVSAKLIITDKMCLAYKHVEEPNHQGLTKFQFCHILVT